MKISILTLGCRTNQAESFQMERILQEEGHEIVEEDEGPELCIINTCTVTAKADHHSKQLIKRALNKGLKIIATGCYAELNRDHLGLDNNLIKVVGNSDKAHIIKMFPALTSSQTLKQNRHARHRPIVKVQDGCNYACSYCAIPSARGRSRSVPVQDVINEITLYESLGYNEIVLTGIHLGTYGIDISPKSCLADLLKEILLNTRMIRIRLSSIEITEINDSLIELLKDNRVCSHLHIPLQSGDDYILKLMSRPYNSMAYTARLNKLLNHFPDLSVGTDVIVGFPGEDDGNFNNTVSLIESLPFSYLHVFPYSSRPGTKASNFSGTVEADIQRYRVDLLRGVGHRKKMAYISKFIGRDLSIVVENISSEGIEGTSRNYIKVCLDLDKNIENGMLLNVHVTESRNGKAFGILLHSK